MEDVICQAIKEKRLLELHSDGHAYQVAPHVYGIDTGGDELLTCYQVWGGSSGEPAQWRTLRLAEISQVTLMSKRFAPHPERQRMDGAIARVFCQV